MPFASGDEVLRCTQDNRAYFFSSNFSAAPFMQ
jgi:hypothetical protein